MSLPQLSICADGSNFTDICNKKYYRGQINEDKGDEMAWHVACTAEKIKAHKI
jgi:hypothetical protein